MNVTALLTSALFIGAVVLGLLVTDAVLSIVIARRVLDADDELALEPDAPARHRIRELSWTVIVTAALAVLVAFAADSAARFVWDEARPYVGAGVLLGVTLLTFLVGVTAVLAVVRRERPTYARIRRDLRDRATATLEADELAEFDERLARADRVRTRRTEGALVLRAIGVAVLIGLAVLAALTFPVGAAIAFGIAALLGAVAFVVIVRARQIAHAASQAVLETQRADVVRMLEHARIPKRGRVPGLGTRVARALAILREQQK